MSWMNRRRALHLLIGGLGAAGCAGIYALEIEPHWVEVVRRILPIKNLPEKLNGASLVQLSDLHVGLHVEEDYILDVFEKVRGMNPDIVAYTGDLVTHHSQILDQFRSIYLRMPKGKRATVLVLGNHDYGAAWSQHDQAVEYARFLEKQDVWVLRNKVVDVDGLQVAGLDDLWAGRFMPDLAFSRLVTRRPMIALTHNPDTVDSSGWRPFKGWILAGHTHGGQFKPPFLAPPRLPVRNRRYTSGAFELSGERRMYINRGIGYLHKARFNVRPEITLFELRPV